ncbi:MAG: hypothetical protein L3J66_02035 [Bacteroidales bacterium]|nr:hypothetical protein [Bacteroidales bacterium]
MSWIGYDPLADEISKNDLKEISELFPTAGETISLMLANINNILFLLVFSIALMFKLFFRKNYNLAEYTSVGFYITGIYTLVKIITMFIGKYSTFDVEDIEFVILFLLLFHSSFSLLRKFNFWAVVKYVLVNLFSIVLYTFLEGYSSSR